MTSLVDFGRIIPRHALLERLRLAQPRIVALVAPAGFGKSTLARQFIGDREGVAICDCAPILDEVDFARRIVAALAEEEPERSATLSQRQLLLGDDSANAAERIGIAIAAWRDQTRSSVFVFENAERIGDLPKVRDVFTRLLSERPESRTVVVCSRVSLRVHLSRFAAPHQIVTLRGEDLAFERRDLDELFRPALDAVTLDRIFAWSQGWPIAVFLLARFACEGRFDALLERLGDVAFEDLHDYLADQVISSLSPSLVDALFAAACIPSATDNDLAIASENPLAGELLSEFGRTSPFVRRSETGHFVVHPLIVSSLTANAEHRRTKLLAGIAGAHEERGDFLRSAELHLARNDQESAARALESFPVGEDRAPSMRYSRLLSSLDRDLVRRYPTLWSCNALFQMFSTDCANLLQETQYLWNALPEETPLRKRLYLVATRVLLLVYLGRFEEALAFIDAVSPSDGSRMLNEVEQGYRLYLRGTTLARLGRIDEAEQDLLQALPFAERMDVMASAVVMLLGSEVARVRGNSIEERDQIARSLEYARRSELFNFVAFRLAEATFSAWLSGDTERFLSAATELGSIVNGFGIRGFGFLAACALGEDDASPRDVDLLRSTLCGHLIAAGNAADRAAALTHACAADQIGKHYPNPFLNTLAALAVAMLSDRKAAPEHYDRALQFALRAGSPNVASAVTAARHGSEHAGMLHAFVDRFRTLRAPAPPPIEINVLDGSVLVSGKEVHLGEREMALAIALSIRPEPVPQRRLIDMLWPDSDEEAGSNALYACLHRLRGRLGEGIVLRTDGGLSLCDGARVDLWLLERHLAPFRSRELANEREYDVLTAVHQRLRCERPERFRSWEWFAPVERFLSELHGDIALRLGRFAVRAGKYQEALALAHDMIARDPCDEGAREVAISAYLELGDQAAARQHYRQYRAVLLEELRCEPSPSISALVGISSERGLQKTHP